MCFARLCFDDGIETGRMERTAQTFIKERRAGGGGGAVKRSERDGSETRACGIAPVLII